MAPSPQGKTREGHWEQIEVQLESLGILNRPPPEIGKSETELPRKTQFRANKSHFLLSYLHHIDPNTNPSPTCPLCRMMEHNTVLLLSCSHIPTALNSASLWLNSAGEVALLDSWKVALAGAQ